MFDSIADIRDAGRKEIVAFLEGDRCMQCYDHESTEELRNVAIEEYKLMQSGG